MLVSFCSTVVVAIERIITPTVGSLLSYGRTAVKTCHPLDIRKLLEVLGL